MDNPHVNAKSELVIQHDVVARPACYWTTSQQAIYAEGLQILTPFETWVTLEIEV